jgi:anti-sigma28 factor (negative regulator of flagellin synthesis)|tara:strand:- start:492 stop:800 length:309 start_codon:yes stop_codon:yes gene_type:complete
MSEISAIENAGNVVVGSVRPASPATPATPVEVAAPVSDIDTTSSVDRVEFSEQAQMLEKIHELPEVRQEHVDAIKEAIANNTYLTDDKIDIALSRLVDDIVS